MPIQTDPTRTSHLPAPTRFRSPASTPESPDPRRSCKHWDGKWRQLPEPLPRQILFSLGKKSRGGEKWGSGSGKLSRGPLAPGCGQESGRHYPGRPRRVLGPAAPRPAARPPASPRPLRAEPSRARRLPTETSPFPRAGLAPAYSPRSDVRRLGAGYLWPGYSAFSLGRVHCKFLGICNFHTFRQKAAEGGSENADRRARQTMEVAVFQLCKEPFRASSVLETEKGSRRQKTDLRRWVSPAFLLVPQGWRSVLGPGSPASTLSLFIGTLSPRKVLGQERR